MPIVPIHIGACMLFLGAAPLPYGYYTLLRLIACGLFAYAAFVALSRKYQILPWIYILLALLFNPFIKVHLTKELWAFIDIGAGILLLVTAKAIRNNDIASAQEKN